MLAILEQVVYIFIYVWNGYDASRAKAMTTFDEYNNNIEEYPTLSAFLKVELRSPLSLKMPPLVHCCWCNATLPRIINGLQ
jgi:hypothetical protein